MENLAKFEPKNLTGTMTEGFMLIRIFWLQMIYAGPWPQRIKSGLAIAHDGAVGELKNLRKQLHG